jgi:hypothetical protein
VRPAKTPTTARRCACGGIVGPTGECAACRAKRLQRERDAATRATPPIIDDVLRLPGSPLEPGVRDEMEARLGHDFSRVRVHTDARAAESARAADAVAYTVGREVVFDSGAGRHDKRLLAHELAHVVQNGGRAGARLTVGSTATPQERDAESVAHQVAVGASAAPQTRSSASTLQRQPAATSENVWGLPVTRGMCGCRTSIRGDIDWANEAAATYASCDVAPGTAHGTDIEHCFEGAEPTAVVVAETSSSGTITLPPPAADPCGRIRDKATFVHETMHSRHVDAMARAQGTAFFHQWVLHRTDPDRLNTLRATFPTQVAAIETQFNDGHDWAQDEINSYRWERRFLEDCNRTLNRICA